MTISRRTFLTGIGASTVAAATGAWQLSVWRRAGDLSTAPSPGSLGTGVEGRTLVVIELGGGNDALNTIVPHGDGRYHDLRPKLGVTDALDLDGQIGLHPALTSVHRRWQEGTVAVVEGVGYPDSPLSHFESMAAWHTASPDGRLHDGWLGRMLDGTVGFDEPLAGIAIGGTPSPALLGSTSFSITISDARGLTPALPPWVDTPDELAGAIRRMAPRRAHHSAAEARVFEALRASADAHDELAGALAPTHAPRATGRPNLRASLSLAADLAASPIRPRVIYVQGTADFDTHQGQLSRHRSLLEDLDGAIDAFWSRLAAATDADGSSAAARTVMMTMSEFGRRPAEAATGTDHGTASSHLVIGPAVRGGRHGAPPDLGALDRAGNLRPTTDFRSLYATVLGGWLGVEPEGVLGGAWDLLDLF